MSDSPESNDDDILDETLDEAAEEESQKKKNYKYGILYLSYIPEGLNVKVIREIMSEFGEVGRIYLEPEKGKGKHRTYLEGWVEFKKKRVAKQVAKNLNGAILQCGKKRSKMNGQVWSIKYLHRFKWAHLTEQLAHNKAVKDQRRRFELSQTKKQVDFYQKMTERSRKLSKRNKAKTELDERDVERAKMMEARQKKPVWTGNELEVPVEEEFLTSIFKKVE